MNNLLPLHTAKCTELYNNGFFNTVGYECICGGEEGCFSLSDYLQLGLDEAQDLIRIYVEDKDTTVEKVVYTGERTGEWWKKFGKGFLGLPIRKDYPK